MNTRITNALIIPMDREGHSFIGDIALEGSTIKYVGSVGPEFIAHRTIDATGYIALPSLFNSHTHLSMGLMRNYKDNEPTLEAWLAQIFPIEDTLQEEDILTASRVGIIEALQSGTGFFLDMYFNAEATAQAVIEAGLRANLGLTLFGSIEDSKARVKRWDTNVSPILNDSLSYSIAPHAIYTCSKETLLYAHDVAKERNVPLHIHLSETTTENNNCLIEHKKTPLQYLIDLGFFADVDVLLAHCVHLSAEDQELMKGLPATIIHNPSSNLKLSSGIAPIATYLEKGLKVLIGTDGASSNNNLNLFEELHLAALLGRLPNDEAPLLTSYQVLQMATTTAANTFNLKSGTLQVGYDADILLVNTKKAHLSPLNDPFSALVYSAQGSDVEYLFNRGELLLEKGQPTKIHHDTALAAVQDVWADIKTR